MADEFHIRLQRFGGDKPAGPPEWALGDQTRGPFWYYQNKFGEKWVATLVDERVVFAGEDFRWKELRVSAEEARVVVQVSHRLGVPVPVFQGKYILDVGEAHWIKAVLGAAFPEQLIP